MLLLLAPQTAKMLADGKQAARAGVLGLLALGALVFAALSTTLYRQPLFPLQTESLAWSNTWLGMTVIDYYGAALCVCAVIFASEDRTHAIVWSLLCLTLGSPFCCLYLASRLASKGTIALGAEPRSSLYE